MEKINENINRFLPFGESLRAILQHDSIKDRERRQLLRMKGVFVNNPDEDSTFPILTTSLLSPNEFEFLNNQNPISVLFAQGSKISVEHKKRIKL